MIKRRKATMDDNHILNMIRKELIPLSYDPTQTISRAEFRRRFNRGRTYVWRAMNSHCKGFIHLVKIKKRLWIDLLAVHSPYRGRGIGSSLLRVAERFGNQIRAESLALFVDIDNQRAIKFYETAGYTIVREIPQTKSYQMEKPLLQK